MEREARRHLRLGRIGAGQQRHAGPKQPSRQLLVLGEFAPSLFEGAALRAFSLSQVHRPELPEPARNQHLIRMVANLRHVRQEDHVAEHGERRRDERPVPHQIRDEALAARVVQIDRSAVTGLPGHFRRDDVVEDRPDVFEAVDAIGDGLLCRIPSQVGRDEQSAAMRLVDDRPPHAGARADVELDGRDVPLQQIVD